MKKGLQTSILISTGVIAGAGIGVGAFVLFKSSHQSTAPIKYTWHEYDQTGLGFKIKEANIKDHGDVRFLGDKGIKVLSQMIKDKMSYGPEVFGLKDIVIGDENIISENTNGLYFPATNEIFINTSSSRKMGFDLSVDPTDDRDIKNRASLLFDIIFHEYGHYLADTYLNSIPESSKWSSHEIYNMNGTSKDSWDKDFLTEFERLLYSDNKKYATTKKIGNTNYHSIGGTYTAKDLYTMVNKTDGSLIDSKLAGKNFVFSGPSATFQLRDSSIIDKHDLGYLFSLPEIWTRKYQQLMMGLNWTIGYKNQLITKDGWFMHPGGSSATNLLSDALSYQKSLREKDRYLGDWVFDKTSGLPIKNKTTTPKREVELYNLMDRHMGHTKGDDISIIWHKNENKIKLNDTGQHIIYGDKANPDLLKLGGYLPANSKFDRIGFMFQKKFITISKITKNQYNFKMKEKLESDSRLPLNSKLENTFYTTDEYKSESTFDSKELYFAEDENGTNATLLTSARLDNDGFATSWRSDQDSSKSNPYRAFNVNGKIVIKKATW